MCVTLMWYAPAAKVAAHSLTYIMQCSCMLHQLCLLPGLHESAAFHDLQALKIPLVAPSLGGVESLITRPATTTHVGMPQEERQVCYHSPCTPQLVSNCSAALSLVGNVMYPFASVAHWQTCLMTVERPEERCMLHMLR